MTLEIDEFFHPQLILIHYEVNSANVPVRFLQ